MGLIAHGIEGDFLKAPSNFFVRLQTLRPVEVGLVYPYQNPIRKVSFLVFGSFRQLVIASFQEVAPLECVIKSSWRHIKGFDFKAQALLDRNKPLLLKALIAISICSFEISAMTNMVAEKAIK